MPTGDTIAAVSTPPGRSARAVIRLSGGATRDALAAALVGPPRPFERACFRSRLRLGERTLPLLAATYRAPASYTGEDSAELLIPGNPHLVERVLTLLTSLPGVRHATPGEFTARAYLNGRLTLDQAEGIAGVIAAESEAQLAGARALLSGRAGARYRRWSEEVATLLALVEAGIDFTDQEDVIAITPGALRARLEALADEIDGLAGPRAAREPITGLPRIVLAGEPNAGKSTLFNALLGRRRAVVSPEAGTTRDVLEEEFDLSRDLPGAGRVLLIDMAGVEASSEPGRAAPVPSAADAETGATLTGSLIHHAAQSHALEALSGADAIIHCDPTARFPPLPSKAPTIRVRTKADLPGAGPDSPALPVCALDGYNLPTLRRAIADAACTGGARSGPMAAILPRHARALADARDQLERAALAAANPELTAAALRAALDSLGDLTGARIAPDDIIGRIFATFCVGK